MDNIKYVDLKTFEIVDNPVGYIPCDKEIVDIIAVLNKKGYKTKSSCAGHNKIEYYMESFSISEEELNNIPDISTVKLIKNNDDLIAKFEILGTSTYIWFKEKYKFNTIPDGFNYSEEGLLNKLLEFYNKEETKRKNDEKIEQEITENLNALRKWANDLEDNN